MTQDLSLTRTILIVESDKATCGFIQFLLQRENYRVLTATDLRRVLPLVRSEAPDLVILDLTARKEGELEICRELRTWYSETILVFCGRREEQFLIDLLDAGADAYVTPPFEPDVLLARIRALLRGQPAKSPDESVIRSGDLEIDLTRRRVIVMGRPAKLTRTEFNILSYLARHQDRPVTTQMILENVWGPVRGDYTQSLRVHIGHIRRKIEPDPSQPRYLLTERGGSYRLSALARRRAARQGNGS
jgi:two-component system KDP operon response regulator KdpE